MELTVDLAYKVYTVNSATNVLLDYQRSPSTNSDERGTATAAMLRSIDNMDDKEDFCDDSLCPAGKKHVGCGEQADVS